MKKIMNFVFLFVCVFAFISCSSVRKVKIVGEPGTIIEVPFQNDTYTIDNSGKVTVSLDRDYYHAYLFSTAPGSDLKVPFALNYKKNNSVYWKTFVGYTGLLTDLIVVICASAGAIKDSQEGSVALAALSYGALSIPYYCDLKRNDTRHKYKYLKKHKTNDDLFKTSRNRTIDLLKSINMSR